MILMAVAEHQRVKRPKAFDIGQEARRRAFAEIEHEALAGRFDDKAGWAFGANAGNKPQFIRSLAHRILLSRWLAAVDRAPNIDKRKPRP
jgi:hypothetical protein